MTSSQCFVSLSDRIQLLRNLSAFTPPTAHRRYMARQVDGLRLCSTRQVHHGGCVAYVANLLPKAFGRSRRRLDPFIRARKTSCVHSKRIAHGRESRDASPLRSCRNQAPLLICSWYKTVQNSMHKTRSDDKLRALLGDCCEVGRRSRMSPFTFRESSPSAGVFVCSLSTPPLLRQILRRLFVLHLSTILRSPPSLLQTMDSLLFEMSLNFAINSLSVRVSDRRCPTPLPLLLV